MSCVYGCMYCIDVGCVCDQTSQPKSQKASSSDDSDELGEASMSCVYGCVLCIDVGCVGDQISQPKSQKNKFVQRF